MTILFLGNVADMTVRRAVPRREGSEGSRGLGRASGSRTALRCCPLSSGTTVAIGRFYTSLPTLKDTPTLTPKAVKRATRLVQRVRS